MNLAVILCACHHVGNPPLIESPNLAVGLCSGLLLVVCIVWNSAFKKGCGI